jgi:hypothetical protein
MDFEERSTMRRVAPVERSQHAQSIGVLCDVREQFADAEATLAMLMKSPWGFEEISLLGEHHSGQFERGRFAIIALEQRFWIKGIDVGRPTFHKHEDDSLGAGWKMRLPRCQGAGGANRQIIG